MSQILHSVISRTECTVYNAFDPPPPPMFIEKPSLLTAVIISQFWKWHCHLWQKKLTYQKSIFETKH